jgi:hypothetical protein
LLAARSRVLGLDLVVSRPSLSGSALFADALDAKFHFHGPGFGAETAFDAEVATSRFTEQSFHWIERYHIAANSRIETLCTLLATAIAIAIAKPLKAIKDKVQAEAKVVYAVMDAIDDLSRESM